MDLINLRFPRFFIDFNVKTGEAYEITGSDVKHIAQVLRMKIGDKAVLAGIDGFDYPAEIVSYGNNYVNFKILLKRENDSEPKIYIRLFQCVPKSDKLDFVVQKATELGVSEIIPVISKRCVSKPKNDSNKITRLQKIAEQAAKQSGRGKIPVIHEFTSFNAALDLYKEKNMGIIFYENGGLRINEIIGNKREFDCADIFIGSEGGFKPVEVEAAKVKGIVPATLGKLILRTETAPITAISILMNLTGEI